MSVMVTFSSQNYKKGIKMHPREAILGLAQNLMSKGKKLPKDLLKEAERLGINLPQENNVKTKGENKDGSKES